MIHTFRNKCNLALHNIGQSLLVPMEVYHIQLAKLTWQIASYKSFALNFFVLLLIWNTWFCALSHSYFEKLRACYMCPILVISFSENSTSDVPNWASIYLLAFGLYKNTTLAKKKSEYLSPNAIYCFLSLTFIRRLHCFLRTPGKIRLHLLMNIKSCFFS